MLGQARAPSNSLRSRALPGRFGQTVTASQFLKRVSTRATPLPCAPRRLRSRPGLWPSSAQFQRHRPAVGSALVPRALRPKPPCLSVISSCKRGLHAARTRRQNAFKGGCCIWRPNTLSERTSDTVQAIVTAGLFDCDPRSLARASNSCVPRRRSRLAYSIQRQAHQTWLPDPPVGGPMRSPWLLMATDRPNPKPQRSALRPAELERWASL